MRNHSAPRQSMLLPTLLGGCFVLAFAASGRAECTTRTYRMTLPEQSTLTLPDGEHRIGSVVTEHGTVEARVVVKDKVVAAPRFFVAGKLLSEVSEAALPEGLRDCVKKAAAAAPGTENWFATAGRSLRDWLVAPAYAAPVRESRTDTTVLTELCFRGTNSHQVCTYRACTHYGFTGKTTCVVLFVTGA